MSVKLQHFNPRAPRGARRPSATSCTWCTTFQSTRPCGARHNVFTADDVLFTISIHAPVWGATGTNSILLLPHSHFNPRARVGRDAYSLENSNDTLISIHAPAWGATLEFQIRLFAVGISIHAPAWGATRGFLNDARRVSFQSTRPRGARHRARRGRLRQHRFQSTRPRGARRIHLQKPLHLA